MINRMFTGLMQLKDAMTEVAKGEGDLTLRLAEDGAEEIAETAHVVGLVSSKNADFTAKRWRLVNSAKLG